MMRFALFVLIIGCIGCSNPTTSNEAEAVLDRPSDASFDALRAATSDACALSERLEALIAADSAQTLTALLAHALRGDRLDARPEVRFGENYEGGSTVAQQRNAERLGYVAGAVVQAFRQRATWGRTALGSDADVLASVLTGLGAEGGVALRAGLFGSARIGPAEPASGTEADGPRQITFEDAMEMLDDHARPLDEQGERYSNEIGTKFERSKFSDSERCD